MLLYALLTGHLPRDPGAARDAPVRRPGELNPGLWRRDLDLIVLKAMHEEPERRYASAQALANDLGRYLAREPVSAAPDAWSYRARLFVRRRRALSLGIAATALSLLLGLAGVLWQAREARQAAARAETLVDYLAETLSTADPGQHGGQWPTLLELLDQAVGRIDSRFGDDLVARARLYATFTTIYNRLNQPEQVASLAPRALLANEQAYGPDSLAVADGHWQFAQTLFGLARYAESAEQAGHAAAAYARHGRDGAAELNALSLRQAGLARTGQLARAEALARELLQRTPATEAARWERIGHLGSLANVLAAQYRFREALDLYDQATRPLEQAPVEERTNLLLVNGNRARVRVRLGDYRDAEATRRQLIADSQRLLGPGNHVTRAFRRDLAAYHAELGRYPEALTEALWVAEEARRVSGADHPASLLAAAEVLRLRTLTGDASPQRGEDWQQLQRRSAALVRGPLLDDLRLQHQLIRLAPVLAPDAVVSEAARLERGLSGLDADEPGLRELRAEAGLVAAVQRGDLATAGEHLDLLLGWMQGSREEASRPQAGSLLYRAYLRALADPGRGRAAELLQRSRELLPAGLPDAHPLRLAWTHVEALDRHGPHSEAALASRRRLVGAGTHQSTSALASLWFY